MGVIFFAKNIKNFILALLRTIDFSFVLFVNKLKKWIGWLEFSQFIGFFLIFIALMHRLC